MLLYIIWTGQSLEIKKISNLNRNLYWNSIGLDGLCPVFLEGCVSQVLLYNLSLVDA